MKWQMCWSTETSAGKPVEIDPDQPARCRVSETDHRDIWIGADMMRQIQAGHDFETAAPAE